MIVRILNDDNIEELCIIEFQGELVDAMAGLELGRLVMKPVRI